MGAQVACGMSYLENHKIVYGKLAARNIAVGDDNICKIADVGLNKLSRVIFIYRMKLVTGSLLVTCSKLVSYKLPGFMFSCTYLLIKLVTCYLSISL